MWKFQNYVPMTYTSEAVPVLKTPSMTGLKVICPASLTFVGASYIGVMLFGYCRSLAGNNPIVSIFNFASFRLFCPIRSVQITLNSLLLRAISNVVGVLFILNGTQEMLTDKGLSLEKYTKIGITFEKISNSTLVKKTKKIYKIIHCLN